MHVFEIDLVGSLLYYAELIFGSIDETIEAVMMRVRRVMWWVLFSLSLCVLCFSIHSVLENHCDIVNPRGI